MGAIGKAFWVAVTFIDAVILMALVLGHLAARRK